MSIKGVSILKGPNGLVKDFPAKRRYDLLRIQTDKREFNVAFGKMDRCI